MTDTKTAELIARARAEANEWRDPTGESIAADLFDELADALQAQEIEQLRAHLAGLESEAHSDYQELETELGATTQRAEAAEARVRELETFRDINLASIDVLTIELAASEVATIKRCEDANCFLKRRAIIHALAKEPTPSTHAQHVGVNNQEPS